jgi:NitT/TauT family transport system substrate-binding protein
MTFTRSIALTGLLLWTFVAPAAAQTPALQDVRIGVVGSDQATALLYADSAGLFRKAGINAIITKASSGAAIASAVAGGALDVGQSQVVSLILAHARSVPFVMIAPTTYYSFEKRDSAIIVPASSPIRSARDLTGKTVGVSSLNDIFTLSLKAWLKQNGVDPDTVHFLEVPPPTAPSALDTGRIDASVVFQPVMALSISSGKFRAVGYPLDAMGKRSEVAAYFTTMAWATAHRDLVDKFAHVLYDASSYVADHERETAPVLAQFSGVDVHVVENMTRPGRALYLVPAELQPYIDAAAQFHLIDKPFPADEMISAAALKPPK